MYVKTAVDKCELGTHFVSQVLSDGDYQNPLRLHMLGDLKIPAADTIANQRFILKSYYDEIEGFHRGGLLITFTVHDGGVTFSRSCVLILHKDFRDRRQGIEVMANSDGECDIEGGTVDEHKEDIFCLCRRTYDKTMDMIQCNECLE